MKSILATRRYTLSPSVSARQTIVRRAGRYIAVALLPVAALLFAGIGYDSRMLYLAAILLFILYPTLMLFGWFRLLSNPWAVAAMYPHIVEIFDDKTIRVSYFAIENTDGKEHTGKVPPAIEISPEDIRRCYIWRDYVVIEDKMAHDFIIPFSAFADRADLVACIRVFDAFFNDGKANF